MMTDIQNEPAKPWWKSTTILSDVFTGLAGIGISIYAYSVHHDAGEAATAFAVFSAAAGVGVYGRVNATQPIGSKQPVGSLSMIIAVLGLAAKAEPVIAAVAPLIIAGLQQLHATHGDAVLLGDIDRLFHHHGLNPNVVAQVIPVDVSVGNSPAQI